MRVLATVLSVLLLAGCKSDAERLDELQTEASLARLRVVAAERDLSATMASCNLSPPNELSCERVDSLRDAVHALRIQRDLAERDLRRFLD